VFYPRAVTLPLPFVPGPTTGVVPTLRYSSIYTRDRSFTAFLTQLRYRYDFTVHTFARSLIHDHHHVVAAHAVLSRVIDTVALMFDTVYCLFLPFYVDVR